MPFELPSRLSPSKMSTFKDCALAFRFSAIDHLPEPPSPAAVKGSLVHAALEKLYVMEAPERTLDAALACLVDATTEFKAMDEYAELGMQHDEEAAYLAEAERLVRNALILEDPTTIHPIGIELRLEVELEGLRLIGIIDRLELDEDGRLVVTDYKTGRAPSERYEQGRLGGVHFYSLLCEELFGQRPAKVQLLHLHEPVIITSLPTDQSARGLRRKVGALWQAVETACEREDFRPKPGPLCSWCNFQAHCPAFGGELPAHPSLAAVEAPTLVRASGSSRFVIDEFDDTVDRAFDTHLRGRPLVDRAMYTITELADFSLLWHLISAARAARGERYWPSSARLSGVLAIQATLVDGVLKSVFRRRRPIPDFERPHHLRMPLTSSFPSGHASAAFCAAGLLSSRSKAGPAWYALATVVAASRVHVKIHHASDVIAGAAVGVTVAAVAKRVWNVRLAV